MSNLNNILTGVLDLNQNMISKINSVQQNVSSQISSNINLINSLSGQINQNIISKINSVQQNVSSQISSYIQLSQSIPLSTSQLTNDSEFASSGYVNYIGDSININNTKTSIYLYKIKKMMNKLFDQQITGDLVIRNLEDFQAFIQEAKTNNFQDKVVALAADIDCSSLTNFKGIGTKDDYTINDFKGLFKGNRKTLKNVTVISDVSFDDNYTVKPNCISNQYGGLFANIWGGTENGPAVGIFDLYVDGLTVIHKTNGGFTGGLAGGCGGNNSIVAISGCVLTNVNIISEFGWDDGKVGGIAGKSDCGKFIKNTVQGTINTTQWRGVGGIVGHITDTSSAVIKDCVTELSINVTAALFEGKTEILSVAAGGIVGMIGPWSNAFAVKIQDNIIDSKISWIKNTTNISVYNPLIGTNRFSTEDDKNSASPDLTFLSGNAWTKESLNSTMTQLYWNCDDDSTRKIDLAKSFDPIKTVTGTLL